MSKKSLSDIKLVELIKRIIAELQKGKQTSKAPQFGLGVSNPIKMKRATNRTQIAELKDRIRIKNLEKELLKRDVTQVTQDQRDFLRQFLNSRNVYEDDGPIIEEIDDENYYQRQARPSPPQPTTRGFSMTDSYGTFGETAGSDRFMIQRAPFQIRSASMNQQPLELTPPSEGSDIIQQQQELQPTAAAEYMEDQPDVYGTAAGSDIPDFGVDPYEQIDAATPFFDQSEEPPTQQQQDIEMRQVIGGGRSSAASRTMRIDQLRTRYRALAGTDLDPTIYRSPNIRPLESAIRDLALREYQSLGGANPQVLRSRKLSLIETELQNLKDALRV